MSKYKEQYQKERFELEHITDVERTEEYISYPDYCDYLEDYSDWLEKRLEEAEGERERLENRLFGRGEMNNAPCFFCGYNGPGYFQPETHACAVKHHRLFPVCEPGHFVFEKS